jgi:hypothetical protein
VRVIAKLPNAELNTEAARMQKIKSDAINNLKIFNNALKKLNQVHSADWRMITIDSF